MRHIAVFGVDQESEQVILYDGTSYDIDAWYNPIGQECDKEKASVAVFQGPSDQWFAVDLRSLHIPEGKAN